MSERARRLRKPAFCDIPGCFWGVVLQRHRIFPGRDGGKYVDQNISYLCPSHHALADKGLDNPEDPRWFAPEFLQDLTNKRIAHWAKERQLNE